MKYEIRNLKISDSKNLLLLLSNIFKTNIKEEYIKNIVNKNNVIDLVAIYQNELIGHAMVEIHNDLFTNEKYIYLNYFCVDEKYRCHGIGEKLLKRIEALALENNIDYMKFTSGNKRIEAHRFYKNRGYTIRDTSVFIKYFKKN